MFFRLCTTGFYKIFAVLRSRIFEGKSEASKRALTFDQASNLALFLYIVRFSFYLPYSIFLTPIFCASPSNTKPATMNNFFKLAVLKAESGIS